MKLLLTAILLLLCSCATPFIARAEFHGDGVLAFDGDVFTVAAVGDGNAALSLKGSQLPIYGFAWDEAIVYASSQDGDWSERYAPGDTLSERALAAFAMNFTATQMAILNTIMQGTVLPSP